MPLFRTRLSSSLLFFLLLILSVSRSKAQSDEGSGLGDDEDESYEDYEEESISMEPNFQTPTVDNDLRGTTSLGSNNAEDDIVIDGQIEDSIYIEDGSGDDPAVTPSRSEQPPVPSYPSTPQNTPSSRDRNHGRRPGQQQPPYGGDDSIVTGRVSNTPPQLQRKLKKVPVTAGKSLRWKIPEDTFFDQEDGTTSKLHLVLRQKDGSKIKDLNWLRFDEQTQILYLLPVDENDIGRWRFQVIARDRHGQTAQDTLEIVVRQYSGSRLVNHQLEIQFSFVKWNAKITQAWKWKFLDTIRRFYRDPSSENIVVRRATSSPFSFAWTNSSLVQHHCRKDEILQLYNTLTGGLQDTPSQELRNFFGEEVMLQSVKLRYFGACLDEMYPEKEVRGSDNNVPVVRNPIDVINITAGEYLQFKVPKDTCYDEEDGETTRLSLQLLTMNRKELASNSWLYFDSRNQEFIGIPLEEEVGREEYQLVCSDQNGLSVIDGIEIVVLNRPFSERYGVEFLFQFASDISHRRVMLVELISSFFGDPTPGNVVLKSVDSQTVVWYNKTLAFAACDDPRVSWMREQLLLAGARTGLSQNSGSSSRNGGSGNKGSTLSAALQSHFKPLSLESANVLPKGSCLRTTAFPPVVSNGDGGSGSRIFHGLIPSVDYLMTFFVPALIIILMLLLAIVLACLLHKKRKAGKLNLFYSEALPPRVPVILQDELVEDSDGDVLRKATLIHGRAGEAGGGGPPAPGGGGEWDAFIPSDGSSMSRPTPTYRR